jgi:hypothetical protein
MPSLSSSTRRGRSRVAFALAALLLGAAAVCLFLGPRHEAGKVSVLERSRMTDVDWIGAQWAVTAVSMAGGSVILVVAGLLLRRGESKDG